MYGEFEVFEETGVRSKMKRFDVKSHVWIDGDLLGLSRHAVEEMQGIAYVQVDKGEYEKGDVCGTVESVKACEDILAPCRLRVVEVNPLIVRAPDTLNERDEWIARVEVLGDDSSLVSKSEYMRSLEGK